MCMITDEPQPSAGLPDRIPTRIVDADQRAVGVAVTEPERFEKLEPAGARGMSRLEPAHNSSDKVGSVAIPSRRFIELAASHPIDVKKDHEAIAVSAPDEIAMLSERLTPSAVETHGYGDVVGVHQPHEVFQCIG